MLSRVKTVEVRIMKFSPYELAVWLPELRRDDRENVETPLSARLWGRGRASADVMCCVQFSTLAVPSPQPAGERSRTCV